jgi:hypothetical protein
MSTAFLAGYLTKTANTPKRPGFDDLFDAVAHAETGHLKNRYVRTGYSGGDGSTAWGPWQIGSMLGDYTPSNKKFYSTLNAPQKDHLNRLHNQRTAMRHFGREPHRTGYHEKWEYSKPGTNRGTGYAVQTANDRTTHRQVVRAIMQDQLRRRKIDPRTASLNQIARVWQGGAMPADHRANWMTRANAYLKSRGFTR